jgi:hypothetical protein
MNGMVAARSLGSDFLQQDPAVGRVPRNADWCTSRQGSPLASTSSIKALWARRSRPAPEADRAQARASGVAPCPPRPRACGGGRVGRIADLRGCAGSRSRRGGTPVADEPVAAGYVRDWLWFRCACAGDQRTEAIREQPQPRESDDRQNRDIGCKCAAHVTIPLILNIGVAASAADALTLRYPGHGSTTRLGHSRRHRRAFAS